MIYSVLQERELLERKAIIKLLGLLFFQSPPMNEQEVAYIETLCAFAGLDEEDVKKTLRLDMRDNWNFTNIIDETLSIGSQKLLLFLAKLSEICFSESKGFFSLSTSSELKNFVETNIAPNIHLGEKAKSEISSLSEKFFKASCSLYDTIYKKSLSDEEIEKTPPAEKIFLIHPTKLRELSTIEAANFISAFNYVNKEIANSTGNPTHFFFNHLLGAFYQHAGIEPGETPNLTYIHEVVIDKTWLKNLVLLSAIAQIKEDKNTLNQPVIREIISNFNIQEDVITKKHHPSLIAYKSACIQTFERLHDISRDDYAAGSTGVDYVRKALSVADLATDFVPAVAGFKRMHKWGRDAGSFVDDLTSDDSRSSEKIFGLRQLVEDQGTGILNICIDGFMSESSKGQFTDWKTPLMARGTIGAISGFAWPSRNFIKSGMTCWYEAVNNSLIYGTRLAEDIKFLKSFNPNIKIRLFGHSLGGRVIHNALVALVGSSCKIDEAYLFGAAVSRTDKQRWAGALQSVDGTLYNFYSLNDEILDKLYRTAQLGDEPAGLGEIEYFKSKGVKQGHVVNVNVSEAVRGHTEYKQNLAIIFNQVNPSTEKA
ncbi:DUF726 domain-containing protein [Billgrantia sp. C5P2]|uniref:DUF726 domain-containing protein n=1 Tax=Billgrantia sp. C5P2 TaxID=3436239 RepID=UPI003DA5EF88